jgi:hypothetical protein
LAGGGWCVLFFLSQEARMLVLKEEKRRRREERKARKAEERKTGQKQPKLQGSGAKLNWREAAKKNVGDDIVFENRCARAFSGQCAWWRCILVARTFFLKNMKTQRAFC